MADTNEASTVLSKENEGENCKANKRMKCEEEDEEEDDLISALPDCIIEHILSFLPSTKDAIRTGVLSKRWLNQWTRVPFLIFKSNNGMSIRNFSNFITKTLKLYNCSKINKFAIHSNDFCLDKLYPKLASWILFAEARGVKELILNCDNSDVEACDIVEQSDEYIGFEAAGDEFPHDNDCKYDLPKFLFNNALLVKLKTNCIRCFPERGKVINWTSLKALHIGFAYLTNEVIENVLSGCPVLEYLELRNCYGFQRIYGIADFVIASKSLKMFRMFESDCSAIEISCPTMEKLELLGKMGITSLKLKDLSPSVCVTLDFKIGEYDCGAADKLKLVEEFLLQVQHVEELKLGAWFLRILSIAAVGAESSLLLNIKCLTMFDPFSLMRQPGLPISYLRFSSLQKLVIHMCPNDHFLMANSVEAEKKFWEVDSSVFHNLLSQLKFVEIVGLGYRSYRDSYNDVLQFVEFLLKKSMILEKVVLFEYPGREMDFAHKVGKKLSFIRKSSPHAVVNVACLKRPDSDSGSDWNKIVG